MIERIVSNVVIGAAETGIEHLLESKGSMLWRANWLLALLDSGRWFDRYAEQMRTAGKGRGVVEVVDCGVVCDRLAVEALRGTTFQLSWFSELYLLSEIPSRLPSRGLGKWTVASADFADPDFDASVVSDLKELQAFAMLADGDWLNFATTSRELVAEIRADEERRASG